MSRTEPGSSEIVRSGIVLAGWMLAALLLAAQAWLSSALRGEPIAWSRSFAVWSVWALTWAVLTPLALRLAARHPLDGARRGRALLLHAGAGIGFATVQLAAFALVAPWIGAASAGPSWSATFATLMGNAFLLDLPVYWVLVALAQWRRVALAARARERRTLQLEAQLAAARLDALRAQLRPHFLFNALNTVSVLMHEDVERADRVLLRIGELLRASLEGGESTEVALRDELALVEAYLAVEQARYGERLHSRIDVAPALLDARVPRLLLQPLVENAVEHGIAPRRGPGRVEVAARVADGRLLLEVADDGPGLAPSAHDGIGLANTRARLELLHGAAQSLQLLAREGGGLRVVVQLPLERMETVA